MQNILSSEIWSRFTQVNQLLAQALAAQTQQAQLAQLGIATTQAGVTLQNITPQPITIASAGNTGLLSALLVIEIA